MVTEKRKLFLELSIVALISYWFFFISTNVNPALGNVYTNITVGAIGIVLVDYFFGKKTIKIINNNISWTQAVLWGVGGYAALLLGTQIATGLANIIPLKEILGLLGASAPVFSNSAFINWVTFGQVIAYIETYALFIAAFDLLASVFKIEISKRNLANPALQLLMLSLTILFIMLHVTAKGIESEAVLILVGMMAYISLFITAWTQDARPGLLLHMLANSIAATALFTITTHILPLIGGAQ